MCLGVPGRVVRIDDNVATVDFWGVHREVRLDIVDEPVAAGDYVLNHVGFAIRRIPDAEVAATMALYDELLAAAEQDDLLAQDVRGEMSAAGGDDARVSVDHAEGDRRRAPTASRDTKPDANGNADRGTSRGTDGGASRGTNGGTSRGTDGGTGRGTDGGTSQ